MNAAKTLDLTACTPFHGPLIAALQRANFGEDWGADALGALLSRPGVQGWLAAEPVAGGTVPEPRGFVLYRIAADECEILSVGVAPEARRRGIASVLMEAAMHAAAEQGAARMFLEVAVSNEGARALYGALGFAEIGRRGDYYEGADGPVDAVVLARDL
jgi:ribosomal-protein-alanine N-acetyltransferase